MLAGGERFLHKQGLHLEGTGHGNGVEFVVAKKLAVVVAECGAEGFLSGMSGGIAHGYGLDAAEAGIMKALGKLTAEVAETYHSEIDHGNIPLDRLSSAHEGQGGGGEMTDGRIQMFLTVLQSP